MPNLSQADRTADEIDWPAGLPRTEPAERERTHKFKVTMHDAIEDVRAELLDRLGTDAWRLSTAAPHRKRDGLPYADASPDDPGVVVRWTMDGDQYAVACDRYTAVRDNLRAIGLYITEKRKMSNRPVVTGQDEFATARLPPGDAEADRSGGAIVTEQPPHEVLDVAPDADPDEIKSAAKWLKAKYHPDQPGGDEAAFKRVTRAERRMLERVEV